jgi:hypothetical protein
MNSPAGSENPAYVDTSIGSPQESQRRRSPTQGTPLVSATAAKRTHDSTNSSEEDSQAIKRLKRPAGAGETEGEGTKDDGDVGPAGGPKHWTDDEKGKLFHWLLDNDERWETFGTKMNTIYREVRLSCPSIVETWSNWYPRAPRNSSTAASHSQL